MSDQKYVNYYIENAVGVAHDYLNTILQLKTQLKMTNDVIAEKDGVIGSLQSEVESLRNHINDVVNQNENLNDSVTSLNQNLNVSSSSIKALEDELFSLRNKTSHMETLINQVNQMKSIIKEKDAQIEALRAPVINTRKKPAKVETQNTQPQVVKVAEPIVSQEDEDF